MMLEKLCLKIIESSSNSYLNRLCVLQLTPIDLFIGNQVTEYIHQVNTSDHCIHKLILTP